MRLVGALADRLGRRVPRARQRHLDGVQARALAVPVAAPDRYDVALRLDLDDREAEHVARGESEDLEVPLGHHPSSPGSRSRSSDSQGGWSPEGCPVGGSAGGDSGWGAGAFSFCFPRAPLSAIRLPSSLGAVGAGATGGNSASMLCSPFLMDVPRPIRISRSSSPMSSTPRLSSLASTRSVGTPIFCNRSSTWARRVARVCALPTATRRACS